MKELEKIEATSRYGVDVFTLAEAGTTVDTSEQGRDLYVATVGTGPEDVWVQGRIHGNEPYGAEAILSLLKDLGTNGSPEYEEIRDAFTIHFIPMYNPDGSELDIRQTVLWDDTRNAPETAANARNLIVDLNRDWVAGKFQARESLAFYEELKDTGFITMDRYQVGNSLEIDIKGGVVSAMMLGLNYQGRNPEGHSNPVVFFGTSGNTSDGSLRQKARGKSIQQNILAMRTLSPASRTARSGRPIRRSGRRFRTLP